MTQNSHNSRTSNSCGNPVTYGKCSVPVEQVVLLLEQSYENEYRVVTKKVRRTNVGFTLVYSGIWNHL
jgi:hypothetical protein